MTKQTFATYLADKYYKTVSNSEQPLFETDNGVYLVPEFCFVTGLPRGAMHSPSKFDIVREVLNATEPDVQKRLLELKKLFFDPVIPHMATFGI